MNTTTCTTSASLPAAVNSASVLPLPGFQTTRIWQAYSPGRYIIKTLIGIGELAILYGRSQSFKSFAALDLALCVASGRPFHSLRTNKGGVLYIAGEGHSGLPKRIRAWLQHHDIASTDAQPSIYFTSAAADLLGKKEQLCATVEEAQKSLGVPISLVVIDTLSANFGGGDENSPAAINLAVTNLKAAAPAAGFIFIHHTPHNDDSRERGSTALPATADVRIQSTHKSTTGRITLTWQKEKDDARPEPLVFESIKVPLGWLDEDGDELTSLVLKRVIGDAVADEVKKPRGKNQKRAIEELERLVRGAHSSGASGDSLAQWVAEDVWRESLCNCGITRNRFHEVRDALCKSGLVQINDGTVGLTRT